MSAKINVVLMPLFIDRVRAFVNSPTMKNWSAVSRLVSNSLVHNAVNIGSKGLLPVLMCEARAHRWGDCGGCPFVAKENKAMQCWHKLRCLPSLVCRQKTLAQRLFLCNQLLAIYDAYDGMSTFESDAMVSEIERDEKKYFRQVSLREALRIKDAIISKLQNSYIDGSILAQMSKLLPGESE